jgi:predicted PurR-regulated permease PerM
MAEQRFHPELDPPKSQRAYDIGVARVALISTSVVVATAIGVALLWRLRVVVLLIFVSLFLGALLHPVVSFVERRGVRRGIATTMVFFV